MSLSIYEQDQFIIKCSILKTKHLTCKISINGVEGLFLVDSGASNSCIEIESEKKFKLDKYKKSYSASGAAKEKFDVLKSKKAEISHEKFVVEKLNFLLIDMKPINTAINESESIIIDGILGADFLVKKKVVLDYKKLTMTF